MDIAFYLRQWMISDSSAASIDAQDLSGADGLFLLITRALDRLKPGAILEISTDNPSVDHDLPAWSRLSANRYVSKTFSNGRAVHRVEKGSAARILTDCDLDWDNHAKINKGHFDTRAWLVGRTAVIRERALRSDGFAPRGAAVETGSPEFPFDVVDRTHAWSESAADFYDQARSAYWDASHDIPWNDLVPLNEELERAVCQLMTFLAENEYSALYVPAKWIARIHPHFAETVLFLSTQVSDEARHIEVFVKRALANGGGLQFSSASTQASLKSLLDQEEFVAASFLLSVLGEGTFLDLLRYIERHAPEAVTREIARRTRIDETRHVHFALSHIRQALRVDVKIKDILRRAITERASVLSGVKGLNPLVEESLVILAAGGLSPHGLPDAIRSRADLYQTMHENRVRRLVTIGFVEREAEELSELHTPNFM
jgi:TusA-related sulfurtransferase